MIRFIAAIDAQHGLADDHGIPWQGRAPTDVAYYKDKIKHGIILMGRGLYRELLAPYPGGINYVATTQPEKTLRDGFAPVTDPRKFLQEAAGDVWNVGGALLFESTIDLADELYLTEIDQTFDCTKFFPDYAKDFELMSSSEPVRENGLTYRFNMYRRKP